MEALTNAQMLASVNAGIGVIWKGNVLTTAAQVPTQAEIDAYYAQISAPARVEVTMKGLYNPAGLDRWHEAFYEIGLSRLGAGYGGIDVVFGLCDSYVTAYGASHRSDTCVAILRNLLQDNHNPVMRSDGTRYGGAGFIPVFAGLTGGWNTLDPKDGGLISDACASYDGTAPTWTDSNLQFMRWSNAGPITNRRVRWSFVGNGAYAIRNRDRITDAEPLIRQFSGDDTVRLDLGATDAFVAISGATGTVNANNATTVQAKHWGRKWTGLTAGNINCPQIGSPSAGTFFNDIFGLIAYCDDWDKGIRVHNLANPGARLALYFSAGALNTYGIAAIDNWGSSAPGSAAAGATRCKLYVINDILNTILSDKNVLGSGTEDVAYFGVCLRVAVARIKALASRPSILYVIPPAGSNANRKAYYPSYINMIKQVMNENLDCMTVLDIGEHIGDGVNGVDAGVSDSGYLATLGISNLDGSHLNNAGQYWLAHKIYEAIR